jgi:hypothetical protein
LVAVAVEMQMVEIQYLTQLHQQAVDVVLTWPVLPVVQVVVLVIKIHRQAEHRQVVQVQPGKVVTAAQVAHQWAGQAVVVVHQLLDNLVAQVQAVRVVQVVHHQSQDHQ